MSEPSREMTLFEVANKFGPSHAAARELRSLAKLLKDTFEYLRSVEDGLPPGAPAVERFERALSDVSIQDSNETHQQRLLKDTPVLEVRSTPAAAGPTFQVNEMESPGRASSSSSKATNPEEHARECSYAPTWQCAPGCPVGGEATQTAEQVSAKLHSTMDARVWTEEFMKVLDDKGTIIASDAGFMIGWFANAIMCGYDIAHQRMAEKQREQAAPTDEKVPELLCPKCGKDARQMNDRCPDPGWAAPADTTLWEVEAREIIQGLLDRGQAKKWDEPGRPGNWNSWSLRAHQFLKGPVSSRPVRAKPQKDPEMTKDEVRASLGSHMRLDLTCAVQGDWWDVAFHAGASWRRDLDLEITDAIRVQAIENGDLQDDGVATAVFIREAIREGKVSSDVVSSKTPPSEK